MNEANPEVYSTSTAYLNTDGVSTGASFTSPNTYYTNSCYTTFGGTREITIKLRPIKVLSTPEYYAEISKLMDLLKDTNWNITSTKVKS